MQVHTYMTSSDIGNMDPRHQRRDFIPVFLGTMTAINEKGIQPA